MNYVGLPVYTWKVASSSKEQSLIHACTTVNGESLDHDGLRGGPTNSITLPKKLALLQEQHGFCHSDLLQPSHLQTSSHDGLVWGSLKVGD